MIIIVFYATLKSGFLANTNEILWLVPVRGRNFHQDPKTHSRRSLLYYAL